VVAGAGGVGGVGEDGGGTVVGPQLAVDARRNLQRMDKSSQNRKGGFGLGQPAHAAVSRRPPSSLYTMVSRTEGYTYDTRVWDVCNRSGAIFCRPVPNLSVTIRNFPIAVPANSQTGAHSAGTRRPYGGRSSRVCYADSVAAPPGPTRDTHLGEVGLAAHGQVARAPLEERPRRMRVFVLRVVVGLRGVPHRPRPVARVDAAT
jgi:hypothetical protein